MPYADPAQQRACDRRYRLRNLEWRRGVNREWQRAHRVQNAAAQRRYSRRRRVAIFERDGWTCVYCGAAGDERTLTLDHKVPRSKGGPATPRNLVTACWACNRRKGTKTYWQFIERIRAERGLLPQWVVGEALEEDEVAFAG